MTRVLAIDAGATKTAAVVLDEGGSLRGRGQAGPGSLQTVERATARDSFRAAVWEALANAGDSRAPLVTAAGVAGVDSSASDEEAKELIHSVLGDLGVASERLLVENDAFATLRGATRGLAGVLIVAGTGSIVVATDGHRRARAGGYGHLVGDRGSALGLVREGLSAAYADRDGTGPVTALTRVLPLAAGVADLDQLLDWLYKPGRDPSEVAALAGPVNAVADDGDRVAAALIEAAGRALGSAALATQLQLVGPIQVHLTGGVGSRSTRLHAGISTALFDSLPDAKVRTTPEEPVVGAAIWALQDIAAGSDAIATAVRELAVREGTDS